MPQLTVSLKDRELTTHALGPHTRIGRDPEMDVVIDNVGVSRHHATLFFDGHATKVRDEGSANGVFVNGQKITEREILDGDQIQIGKFSLTFSTQLSAQAELMPQAGVPSARSARSRDMMKTFAMNPNEVQQMLSGPASTGPVITSVPRADEEDDEGGIDPAIKIVGGGALIIAALGTVVFLLL